MIPINSPFSGMGPLLLFLAKATVLLVAASVAMIPLRRGTAGARHLVWLAALVGVLALPLLSRVPALRLDVLPRSLSAATERPRDLPAFAPAAAPAPPKLSTEIGERYAAPAAPSAPAGTPVAFDEATSSNVDSASILSIVGIVWAGVALALVGWLVAGAAAVRRIVAKATELTTPDWTTPLCEVADRLDLELPPRLVISDRIEMAFACRALAPTIVLPASAESWSDDRRRAVLFHELAHVKRRDLLGHLLGRLACALYWFHPLVWAAAKNLRNESERACDDLVLRCGARPSEYAQHLLDMVTSVRHHGAPVMALPMARKKEFEGRMLAILDPAIRRASPGRWQAAGVVATIALLSVTVAAVSPAASAPAPAVVERETSAPTPPPEPRQSPRPTIVVRHDTDRVTVSQTSTTTSSNESTVTTPIVSNDFIAAVARGGVEIAGKALAEASREMARELRTGKQSADTARVSLLIRILSTDADPRVRRTAAWGLTDLQTSAIAPALIKALRSDSDATVREMAAWGLAEHGGGDTESALAGAMLHDRDARVRGTSVWALGDLGSRRHASEIESALVDSSADVRYTAIWALGQLDLRRAPRGLTATLTDPSPRVRLVTAWALGEIEDAATAPAVLAAFQTETDAKVRSAELRALAAMGQATPAVVDMALKSSDPELRRRAVAMLAGSDAGVWPWPWPWPQPRPTP